MGPKDCGDIGLKAVPHAVTLKLMEYHSLPILSRALALQFDSWLVCFLFQTFSKLQVLVLVQDSASAYQMHISDAYLCLILASVLSHWLHFARIAKSEFDSRCSELASDSRPASPAH